MGKQIILNHRKVLEKKISATREEKNLFRVLVPWKPLQQHQQQRLLQQLLK